MRHRWLVLVLLCALVLGVSSASAAVTIIDAYDPPPHRLDPSDVAKLEQLTQAVSPPILSGISPDDQALLTISFREDDYDLVFLNINDGSTVPVDPEIFNRPILSEIAWRDGRTATFISADIEESPNGEFSIKQTQIFIDRTDGSLRSEPLSMDEFVLSLAPNASRALVALIEETDAATLQSLKLHHTPFPLEIERLPFGHDGRPRFNWQDRATLHISSIEFKLAVYDFTTKQLTELLTLPDSSGLLSAPSWSADGSKLALHRIEFPRTDGDGSRLNDSLTQIALGNVPPTNDPLIQNNVVDVFDFATGAFHPAAIKAHANATDWPSIVAWNPSGTRLMLQMEVPARLQGRTHPVSFWPERSYLRFYDANLQVIDTLDRAEIQAPNAAFPFWANDDNVLVTAPHELNYHIFRYDLATKAFNRVPSPDGTIYTAAATTNTQQVVFTHSSFQQPYEMYQTDWAGAELKQLTNANAAIAQLNNIRVDELSFTLRSGAVRRGFLLQPASAPFPPRTRPLVHWQQGGPGGTITNEWGAFVEQPFNLLPNLGIPLLVVPLPGREGWGPQFYNALADGRNFGQVDIDEGAEIVAQLIAQGYTGRGKVAVTGCSYGGYYASQSITRHPTTYAAANPQCSLLDLYNEWQFGQTAFLSYLMGRVPTADPHEYAKDSPLYNAAKVRARTLIFHGSDDFLPVTLALNFHDQIEDNGAVVEMLQFDYEGHGLFEPSNQLTAAQAQVEWFRRHLAPPEGHTLYLPMMSRK